jgi:hypothetical protein
VGSSAKSRAPQVGPTRGRRGAVHVEIIAGGHDHLDPGILLCCAPHLLADSKLGPGFAGWISARALRCHRPLQSPHVRRNGRTTGVKETLRVCRGELGAVGAATPVSQRHELDPRFVPW